MFTHSYTRIHVHFFGATNGKAPEIKKCPPILKDRAKYQSLLNRMNDAKSKGVSKSLKNSIINKKASTSKSKKPLEESFGMMKTKHN